MTATSSSPATPSRVRVIRCVFYTRSRALPASDEGVNAQAARLAACVALKGWDQIPVYLLDDTPADGDDSEPQSL